MFSIDPMSRIPVYEQIIDQVWKFVAAGLLSPGDQLPSVRSLSVELSVNPNTIQKAFSELYSRGLITSVPGRGSFISSSAPDIIRQKDREKTADLVDIVKRLHAAGMSREELITLVEETISSETYKEDDRK